MPSTTQVVGVFRLKEAPFHTVLGIPNDFKTDTNLEGREMNFRIIRNDVEYLSMIAVVLVSDDLYIVEAGGEKEYMEPDLEHIRVALKTIR